MKNMPKRLKSEKKRGKSRNSSNYRSSALRKRRNNG
jgi:hypothetical protein